MSESGARTAIYNAISAVSNIGNVYTRDRWAALQKDFQTIATTTIGGSTVIRFWTITCPSIAAEWHDMGTTIGNLRHYQYIIRGAFGMDDSASSENTAIAIAEDVMEALDGNATLQAGFHNVQTAQLNTFELRLVAGHLCHYVEIGLVIDEVMA